MSVVVIVCAAAAGVVATAGSLVAYFTEARAVERHITAAPRRRIADLAEGERACVVGTARTLDDKTIPAALTGRTCLYYIASIEERVGASWLLVIRERRGVSFVLDDGSGHAVIDPWHAEVSIELDGKLDSSQPSERVIAMLARHDLTLPPHRVRYREGIIEPGERVAVLGEGVREADPEGTVAAEYRGDAPTRLRLTSSTEHPLAISDRASVTRS